MTDPERRAYPRGERPPRDDERPGYGVSREDLANFSGIVWQETAPHSGRYIPAAPTPKPGANWPQAFMVAAVFGSFAAMVWALAWVIVK